MLALFALIPVLWFLPELWGSGHLLRGVTRAQHPRSNSAAFAKCPVCTVFKHEAWPAVLNRVKVRRDPRPGGRSVRALAHACNVVAPAAGISSGTRARAWLLGLGLFGYLWWFGIALETQAGFSGNNRYLVLGTAPVAIAGGIAWGWIAQTVARMLRWLAGAVAGPRRLATTTVAVPAGTAVAVGLFLAVPPWIGQNIISLPRTHHALVYQARLREDLTAAVHDAGGGAALLKCGSVMTEGFQVPMVAWTLGVRTLRVQAEPSGVAAAPWPNVILQTRAQSKSTLLPTAAQIIDWERDGAPYKLVAHVRTFRIFSTCGGKVNS